MLGPAKTSLTISAICLGLTIACSLPHINSLRRRWISAKSKYRPLDGLYEDKDGIATKESEAQLSDITQRLVLILASIVATLIALASAVYTSSREGRFLQAEQWLQAATWIILLFHSIVINLSPSSVEKFDIGIWTALSALSLAVAIPVEDFSLWLRQAYPKPQNVHATFSIIQFVLALAVCISSALIPRRPDVYHNGRVVDRQNTTSFLGRYTFAWPEQVLLFANRNRGLKTDDLPIIGDDVRAGSLQANFDRVGRKDKLWKQIVLAHKSAFITQWTLQLITSVTNFLPQIVLYLALRLLEARDAGDHNQVALWLVAIGIGGSVAVSAWLESLLYYTVYLRLNVPVYEQMAAVIFCKAIRKKDVKSAAVENSGEDGGGETTANGSAGPKDEETAKDSAEDDEEEIAKTKQGTINLIGVDGKRVADFAAYNYIFLGSATKLILAVVFLVKLIGWIPMLCGFAAPALITPINWIVAKHYGAAQDNLMKYRDQKLAVVTEALQGIRQIKFSALEKDWYEKILKTRRRELAQQWLAFKYDTILISIWIFGPVCLSAISLTAYAMIHGELSASIAFTTISVFEAIEMTLAIIPELVTDLLDALVSQRRLQEYLDSDEREDNIIDGPDIVFEDATVSWPSDEQEEEEDRKFNLHSLNLRFKTGELNVISGKTGSGKSLLLSAIIGEADILSGKVTVPRPPPVESRADHKAHAGNWILPSTIAYVSQIPWIENATLRDNILFGLPYDAGRYQQVVKACALEKDLEMLQDGDMTDIGANGINLSGGQKWRTSFARALYSRAGILVLDDIFSAVDAHVGRQLYENALIGPLCEGRTRVLVTHHVALCLPGTKYSVLLDDGAVAQAGDTDELRKTGLLKDILAHDVEEQTKKESEAEFDEAVIIDDGGHDLVKVATNHSQTSRRLSAMSTSTPTLERRLTRQKSVASMVATDDPELTRQVTYPKKFTEDENREVGAIKWQIYKTYVQACRGFGYWSLVSLVYMSWIVVYLARSYWISNWTRQYRTEDETSHQQLGFNVLTLQRSSIDQYINSQRIREILTAVTEHGVAYYVGVYLLISLLAWIVGTIRYFLVYTGSIRGSHVLFEKLTNTILRTPLRFLDVTPVGRITNRFTADFNMVDSRIANDLGFMMHCGISVLSVVIAGVFVSPFMLGFAALLFLASYFYANRYLTGARECKRLESNAKSPIFEQFGSVLTGIGTIRAFDKSSAYVTRMFDKINTHCVCYWHIWLFNRWMGFRLNMVGAAFSLATAALIVSLKSVDAPLAGFALSFSLQMADSVIWALRQYANVELDFNAVERIVEYSNLDIEDQGGEDAPAAWPTKGRLEVKNLSVSYAKDLPPVLKKLTFNINPRERIGVVGRTGAGKSSLTLALFRFLEARGGSIMLDGVDISKIKLYDLRSRGLAIIPQDPVLFSGTVRSNLDPFDQHSDFELREALARAHLVNDTSASASGAATPRRVAGSDSDDESAPVTTSNTKIGLSTRIAEGGLNLSQGQRQLLCLARAVVSRPRIMVLDEATSSVDMETDKLIQKSIREEFAESTLIVIAHRLSTIADFDRILVLGDGEVKEYDTPKNLMAKKNGDPSAIFKDMVEKSGERSVLEGIIRGESGN